MCCSSTVFENATNDLSGFAGEHMKWHPKVFLEMLLSFLLLVCCFCFTKMHPLFLASLSSVMPMESGERYDSEFGEIKKPGSSLL